MYKYSDLIVPVFGFNPAVDIKAVDPSGVIDLCAAYSSGSIPGDVVVDEERFNGCSEPDTLMPRPKDWFEAIRQTEYVKSALRAAKSETEPVTPSGETN